MKTQILILPTIFASLLLVTVGAIGASPDFLVEMKIVESGTEVATPRMIVKEGSGASMSISGENVIAVGLVVNASNESEVHIMAEIDAGESSMSPELLVEKGEWASVSVGDLEFHMRVERLASNY